MKTDQKTGRSTLIWDLPTRLFHWMLAATLLLAWLTTSTLYFEIHLFAGYLLVLLLLFRALWGIVGGTYSRFSQLLYPWKAVHHHLTEVIHRKPLECNGHTPTGSWMIFLMLSLLSIIALTGLLTLGGEEQLGPMAQWISIESGAMMHELHKTVAWVIVLLIPIHIAGVIVESYLNHNNFIRAMFTGFYTARERTHDGKGGRWSVVSILLFTTPALALWYSTSDPDPAFPLYPNGAWNRGSAHTLWQEECGSCHTPHHPSLLPERSWSTMLQQQNDHFGEDLALDEEGIQSLSQFLNLHAAEHAYSEAAWKISNSIDHNLAPVRITSTTYWREKHQQLQPAIWNLPSVNGKVECGRCHQDAESGTFHDRAVQLPGV